MVEVPQLFSLRRRKTEQERFLRRRAHLLPWIGNPFALESKPTETGSYFNAPQYSDKHGVGREVANSPEPQEEEPQEEERAEALPIQLLYDLFFVAALSAVTGEKSIYDNHSLIAFCLYFLLIWFTWLHVTFYDLRYSIDSVYERFCKIFQFGTMVLFCARASRWNPFKPDDRGGVYAMQLVTLALLGSRLLLALQYGLLVIMARKEKLKVTPLLLHVGTMLIGAIAYVVMYVYFSRDKELTRYYWVWFVVVSFEVAAVVVISSIRGWDIVTFKRGHLMERMGTLTLIMLGEGILVFLKSVSITTDNDFKQAGKWGGPFIIAIIASLIITYLCWMFYFDYTPKHLGNHTSLRQQIWAVLHFPLHVGLVVYSEALRQYFIYWRWSEMAIPTLDLLTDASDALLDQTEIPSGTPKFIDALRSLLDEAWDLKRSTVIKSFYQIDIKDLNTWKSTTGYKGLEGDNGTLANEARLLNIYPVYMDIQVGLLESFGIKNGDYDTYTRTWREKFFNQLPITRDTEVSENSPLATPKIFVESLLAFFFILRVVVISLGVTFLLFGILSVFVRGRGDVYDFVAVGLRFCLAIIFLSLIAITGSLGKSNEDTINNLETKKSGAFVTSDFFILFLAAIITATLLLGKFSDYIAYARAKKRYMQAQVVDASDDTSRD